MSNAAGHSASPARNHRPHWRPAFRLGWNVIRRVYAVVLILIVLWLSWLAFRYLVRALVFPAPPPAQIVDLPRRAAQALRAPEAPAFAGTTAVENPRTPLGHYHRVGEWFQPDRFNDCTRSGCHAPLPHGRNKADRAFLNMHATSFHCGVCHLQTEQAPLPLAWYDLTSGRTRTPPALLAAYAALGTLHEKPPAEWTANEQKTIASLLASAATEAGADPALTRLAEHFRLARVDGEEFPPLVEQTLAALPSHFRGEYGAKIALLDPATRQPRLRHPGSEAAVREYLAQMDALQGTARDAVLTRVHPLRRQPTLNCTDCHKPAGGLVDFAALGYPPARVQQLVQPIVMSAIEHIVRGEEFHMPGFVAPGSGPESQPSGVPARP